MQPTAVESIRGIQTSLFEVIAPELRSPFAQHTLQTMFMLLESLAAEIEQRDAAEGDRERVEGLLIRLSEGIRASETADPGLLRVLADLEARQTTQAELLEKAIVGLEERAQDLAPPLQAARREIYAYLREVAGRGWSFWDMVSFRKAPS